MSTKTATASVQVHARSSVPAIRNAPSSPAPNTRTSVPHGVTGPGRTGRLGQRHHHVDPGREVAPAVDGQHHELPHDGGHDCGGHDLLPEVLHGHDRLGRRQATGQSALPGEVGPDEQGQARGPSHEREPHRDHVGEAGHQPVEVAGHPGPAQGDAGDRPGQPRHEHDPGAEQQVQEHERQPHPPQAGDVAAVEEAAVPGDRVGGGPGREVDLAEVEHRVLPQLEAHEEVAEGEADQGEQPELGRERRPRRAGPRAGRPTR